MVQDSKPRIDFYKLNTKNDASVIRFCCQLTEKVFKMGHAVCIRTKDEKETRLLDDMMWTYSDSSFLPHERLDERADADAPVLISHRETPSTGYLLINLGHERPENIHNYERIAEIVNDGPDALHHGRIRYSDYKKGAFNLHYHEITA